MTDKLLLAIHELEQANNVINLDNYTQDEIRQLAWEKLQDDFVRENKQHIKEGKIRLDIILGWEYQDYNFEHHE